MRRRIRESWQWHPPPKALPIIKECVVVVYRVCVCSVALQSVVSVCCCSACCLFDQMTTRSMWSSCPYKSAWWQICHNEALHLVWSYLCVCLVCISLAWFPDPLPVSYSSRFLIQSLVPSHTRRWTHRHHVMPASDLSVSILLSHISFSLFMSLALSFSLVHPFPSCRITN